VTVPPRACGRAEDRATRPTSNAPAPRLPPGEGAGGGRQKEVRRGHPPAGAAGAGAGEAARRGGAGEAQRPIADPHSHNLKWEEARRSPSSSRRGEARAVSWSGRRLPADPHVPAVTEAPPMIDAQLNELRGKRRRGRRSWMRSRSPRTWCTSRSRRARVGDQGSQLSAGLGEGRAIPEVEERIMTLLPAEMVDRSCASPTTSRRRRSGPDA